MNKSKVNSDNFECYKITLRQHSILNLVAVFSVLFWSNIAYIANKKIKYELLSYL